MMAWTVVIRDVKVSCILHFSILSKRDATVRNCTVFCHLFVTCEAVGVMRKYSELRIQRDTPFLYTAFKLDFGCFAFWFEPTRTRYTR